MSTLTSVLDFNAVFIFSLPNLPGPVNKYKHQTASFCGGNKNIQVPYSLLYVYADTIHIH